MPNDDNVPNNKSSQITTEQSKVKVRLKTIPPSPQTKKTAKPTTTATPSATKTPKSVEQKSIKKYDKRDSTLIQFTEIIRL